MAESMRGPPKIMPSLKRQHHFTRTMPIQQREPHFHTPRTPHSCHTSRAKRPRGPGAVDMYPPAPSLSCLVFRCVSETQEFTTCLYPHARHAGPRGRRTSPACGSCRRPLKKCENQGTEESNGGKKKYFASKEGTLRPSREGTKCIIFLPILEPEGKSRKNQWFSSPRHRRARAAHLQERIPFNGF